MPGGIRPHFLESHARRRNWRRAFYCRRRRATLAASKPEVQRPMDTGQREEIVARKAKAQQIRKPESVSAKLPKHNPINTRLESAKAAGFGERTEPSNPPAASRHSTASASED